MGVRVVARAKVRRRFRWAMKGLMLLVGLLLASLLFIPYGLNPLEVYARIIGHSLATKVGLTESVVRMIPLLLVSSGLVLVFRANFWNIGAEGQLLAGAMAAYVVHPLLLGLPPSLAILTMFVVGFVAGAVYALPPALLKAKLNVNEVISTLMLYYVLYWVFQHLIHGPWKAVETVGGLTYGGFAHTKVLPEQLHLPVIGDTRIHWPTLVIALLAAAITQLLLWRGKLGFEIRAIGGNRDAAEAAGMSYLRVVGVAMLISGGLAGLAGVGELLGIQKRFTPEFLSGYGFIGIITAWLGKTNIMSLLVANFLYGALLVGGEAMMIQYKVPIGVIDLFNGTVLLSVLVGEFLARYEVRIE